MTNIFRTVPAIQFDGLEDALATQGIASSGITSSSMTLIGAKGTLMARMENGYAEFTHASGDVKDIFEAIENAFDTSVLDEDQWDFWCRNAGLIPGQEPFSLLIEGPPITDPQSACNWVKWVQKFDDAKKAPVDSEFPDDKLYPRQPLAPCAIDLLTKWFAKEGVFHVNLNYSQHAHTIVSLIAAGFLRKVGVRYQMTLPEQAGTNILESYHSRKIVPPLTMFREDAEALARSLRTASRQAHPSLRCLPTKASADA